MDTTEQKLAELVRLYTAAQNEREKAELQQRIAELEAELGGRANSQGGSAGLESKVDARAQCVISASSKDELEELLKRKGISSKEIFDRQYYVILNKDLQTIERKTAMYEHPLVLIGIGATKLKDFKDKDKIRRLAIHGLCSDSPHLSLEAYLRELPKLLAGYANVEILSFSGSEIKSGGADAVIRLACTGRLTHLDLRGNHMGLRGAQQIAGQEHAGTLRHILEFFSLGRTPRWERLTHLDISEDYIGDGGAQAIARSQHMRTLRHLGVCHDKIGPEGAEAIARSQHMRTLRHLNISGNDIGDAGIEAIAHSEYIRELRRLLIYKTRVGDEGALELANSSNMAQVNYLDIRDNNIHARGVYTISGSKYLTRLAHFDLSKNRIGDEGAQAIASSTTLGGLTYLDLSEAGIGSKGARAIANSEHIMRLKYLGLGGNDVPEETMVYIARRFTGKMLSLSRYSEESEKALYDILGDRLKIW